MNNRVFKKIFYPYTILVFLISFRPQPEEIDILKIWGIAVLYLIWMFMVPVFVEMKKKERAEKKEKQRKEKIKSRNKNF